MCSRGLCRTACLTGGLRQPEGSDRKRLGFCSLQASRAWRGAAGFPRGGGSLAPRRSKEAPKTGYHGGRMRQPQRNRFIPKAAAIPHALGEGYRALRAPASPSVLCADSQAPKDKSCCAHYGLTSAGFRSRLPGLRPPAVIMPAAPRWLQPAASWFLWAYHQEQGIEMRLLPDT